VLIRNLLGRQPTGDADINAAVGCAHFNPIKIVIDYIFEE